MLYALSTTELHQLLKVPVLISHFMEHKSGNENLGIMQFLAMHYATEKDHDARDKELPFKSVCDSACASVVYLPEMMYSLVQCPETFAEIQYGEFLPENPGLLFQSTIWQPPRQA